MKIPVIICALGMLLVFPAFAAEPTPAAAAISYKLISALNSGDHGAFIADGEEAFKGLKKEQFDAAVQQFSPRLKSGYEVTYLGDLKQKGYEVSLWKITFKDGGDDLLGTLSLKDGKVGGFWLK